MYPQDRTERAPCFSARSLTSATKCHQIRPETRFSKRIGSADFVESSSFVAVGVEDRPTAFMNCQMLESIRGPLDGRRGAYAFNGAGCNKLLATVVGPSHSQKISSKPLCFTRVKCQSTWIGHEDRLQGAYGIVVYAAWLEA
jgi:hypothetical protein